MGTLRFILAISVVLAHSSSILGLSLVGGQIAVQAFYIISGFYMSLVLNEKYIGVNNSYKLFITNRLLRLYPIYWVVFLLTVSYSIAICIYSKGVYAGGLTIYIDYWDSMNIGSFIFLLFTNLFLFLQDTVMFLGLETSTGYLYFTSNFQETSPPLYKFLICPQAWTIGIEIAFYLIAPFIVRRKLKTIIVFIMMSLLVRFFLYQYSLEKDPWSYRFFPTELAFFLLGIVSYHIYINLRKIEIESFYLKIIWSAILIFTFFYDSLSIPGKGYIYLFAFSICLPFVFILTKNWKEDSYIGELSYPIYISHIFVLTFMAIVKVPFLGGTGLYLIMTVLFSIVLNELVAKKVEKIRQKRIIRAS